VSGAQATPYAGFWRRAAAGLLDILAYTPLGVIVVMFTVGPSYWQEPERTGLIPVLLIGYGLPALYAIGFWMTVGATPGKWVLGLQVVEARSGGRVGLMTALLRYVGYFVSALPLGLGFIWIAFDREKRGWHDMLAKTRVTVAPTQPPALEEIRRRLA
jgi:uncharacterized RDD family membrane protein YckC